MGEGEERVALERLRSRLGLNSVVSLPGVFPDITNAYKHASIFCLSSRYEGFGLVLLEAMAFGLPVVSTDCETGPRELLDSGHDALVVPVDDSDGMAQALLRLIVHQEDATRLGKAARQKAHRFSMKRIVSQWQALLGRSRDDRRCKAESFGSAKE
ncbi:glycosyl transferase group 1 [Cupriavidus basilensis OR16]|uniref:Glycosyl transferase group 1 n=1 Tax=Cupriavidus basilensis OR16 TaxID=1127483 RepID=H1SBG8_9BURK|nr:glycosyl transferase group 1 [Cupriavidus basilensis OR16]